MKSHKFHGKETSNSKVIQKSVGSDAESTPPLTPIPLPSTDKVKSLLTYMLFF